MTSIFAEIAGIKWGAAKVARKKKKITDKKNKETEGLCQTLGDFYKQKIFRKVAEQFFKSEEGKGLKTRVEAGKKKKKRRKKQPPRIHNCLDSLDYNEFLTHYYKNNEKEPIKLECDLLKPKLSFVPDVLCETIGQYFIQFGIKVYYNFFKYLFNIGKKAKRGIFSRSVTGQMKRMVKKYEESGDKKKYANEIQKWVDRFYDLSCSKIMPHYNAFYIFYNDYSKSKEHKGFVKTANCDYFVRIPRINTENKIND